MHRKSCDVFVAGGGAAGVPCALAAARTGASVILCHDRPVLGGNASSEVRMHIVGANGVGQSERGEELATEAREGGIIEEIRLDNAVLNPQRSPSVFDLILYDKCRSEPNLELMLNTAVVGAELEGNKITTALAECPSTETSFRINADVFIDCTGDGRLGMEAGASFMEGREGINDFGESLAVAESDSKRLGSTILIQARKHGHPMPFRAPDWARRFSSEDLQLRLYATPGDESPTHEYGYWWAEWGGTLDTIRDNETIRDELLSITLGIWDHIKNGAGAVRFQAENWALEWIGFLPGKRESRRFIGQHIMTEGDILNSRPFHDRIAYGGWSLDLHPPEGVDAPELEPCEQHVVPFLYDIPLRSCVSRDLDNLMFAGRNISATHVAFSSTRVMATCAVIGQGVGTAAAIATQNEKYPCDISRDDDLLKRIQSRLLEDDCFLIGLSTTEQMRVIDSASITSSSEQLNGSCENIRSSQTRSVHGNRGCSPGRCEAGSHRWMSDPLSGLPAWLQLDWEDPVEFNKMCIVFDTGLYRHLTLSHHDGYTSAMHWGSPQPETVKDYSVEVRTGGLWTEVLKIENNYQRMNRHQWDARIRGDAFRLTIYRTNGLDHARVVSLRLFD
ncbi:MAG: FAD-dependent oxidoreductase [Verrucomicrobiales bacterium]|nr:FAD-dependent oxidoreductase [Verrucomicrobiales bacterium]